MKGAHMREIAFLFVLAVAAGCVVVGVAHWSAPVAWVVAGLLLAGLGWLGLADVPAVDGGDL